MYVSTAQICVSTGFKNAGNFITDNSNLADYDISDPSFTQTSNNSRAIASSLALIGTGNTFYLKATNFNFALPSYAVVCGVTVEIEARAQGLLLTAAVRDNEVKLVKNGSVGGNNKAQGGDWGSGDAYRSYGGSADLWGNTLTAADVNASNFGVALSARLLTLIAVFPSAEIDHIRMSINYNLALPIKLTSFTALKNNNSVSLEWKTVEQDDLSVLELERSVNNSKWETIQRLELQANPGEKNYSYLDKLTSAGDYSYRIKLTSGSGQSIYSSVKQIHFSGTGESVFYPNPVVDYCYLENIDATATLTVRNSGLQHFPVKKERVGQAKYRIDLSVLPPGIYFINTGRKTIPFLKQ